MTGIPIESLKLSVRANNVLHRMSIHCIEQLIGTPIEQIADQRNVGAKTVAEIGDILHKIETDEFDIDSLSTHNDAVNTELKNRFSYDQLVELSHHSITELDIPTRAFNTLMKMQCITIDKVVTLTEEEIRNIKGLGAKSANELISGLHIWLSNNMFLSKNNADSFDEVGLEEQDYFQRLEKILNPITHIYWKSLRQLIEESGLTTDIVNGGYSDITNENVVALLELPDLYPGLKKCFLEMAPSGIIRIEQLGEKLSDLQLDFDSNILFNKLCDGTICSVSDGYCYINRDHFLHFISKHCNDMTVRNNAMLIKRIHGENLQTIGDEYGLTRERVRQILVKTVSKFPLMYEDFFREPYEYFRHTKEEFCNAFPSCGDEGYEYLVIRYAKGKETLTVDNIKTYNGVFAERLGEYLKEEFVRQDKRTASRTDIVYRVLISNSDRALTLDEFETEYYDYIERKGYPRERLELNIRTVTNHLRNAKHIVFNKNNCVRYCDVDAEKIWNVVDFRQYNDCVISAELIFRDYEELMDELDIRDGYELFYVIKSSLEYWNQNEFEINCRRIPVMVFGNGDEERQAIRLLKEVSPIGYLEYYEAYEERYGIRKESAQGNPSLSTPLSQYYSNGQYAIDVPAIDERDVELFKEVLSQKTIWFMDELEKAFRRVCVHSSMDALNTAAFKRIGYSLNVGYAYNDSYGTVSHFFDAELFSSDIVNMTDFDRRLVNLPAFISALDKKKKTLEYIETAPKILMSISKIREQFDIDVDDIRTLQDWVLNSCDDKYFNAHSLWRKLEDNQVINKLQNNEWMCTCIFRQQESVLSLSVAGGIILSKDSGELSLSKICEWLVEKNGRMTIQNLTSLLNETFGTNIPYYKIADKLKTFGAWDSLVTDSFEDYIDTLVGNTDMDMDEADFFQEEFF